VLDGRVSQGSWLRFFGLFRPFFYPCVFSCAFGVERESPLRFRCSECHVCPCVNATARALLAGLGPFSVPRVFSCAY
jgi:hypothetical protein